MIERDWNTMRFQQRGDLPLPHLEAHEGALDAHRFGYEVETHDPES